MRWSILARSPRWRPCWRSSASSARDLERRLRAQLAEEGHGEETVAELLQAVPTAYQWGGLDRYWRKRAEREAA